MQNYKKSEYPVDIMDGRLYLGNMHQANSKAIKELKITHIVNATRLFTGGGQSMVICLRLPIVDSDKTKIIPHVKQAISFIDNALNVSNTLLSLIVSLYCHFLQLFFESRKMERTITF